MTLMLSLLALLLNIRLQRRQDSNRHLVTSFESVVRNWRYRFVSFVLLSNFAKWIIRISGQKGFDGMFANT
jgi:hypothetical protein